MVVLKGSATKAIPAPADAVFATITDPFRLPQWNPVIKATVDGPPTLDPGCEWVVSCQAMRAMKWKSRSRCEALVVGERRFVHRSATDDGNPSYATWTWKVSPTDAGSRVDVTWELHPLTFWRRLLMARIRHRMLQKEVSTSLNRLAELTAAGDPPPP